QSGRKDRNALLSKTESLAQRSCRVGNHGPASEFSGPLAADRHPSSMVPLCCASVSSQRPAHSSHQKRMATPSRCSLDLLLPSFGTERVIVIPPRISVRTTSRSFSGREKTVTWLWCRYALPQRGQAKG